MALVLLPNMFNTLAMEPGYPEVKRSRSSGRLVTTRTEMWTIVFTKESGLDDVDPEDILDALPSPFQPGHLVGSTRLRDQTCRRHDKAKLKFSLKLEYSSEDELQDGGELPETDKPPDQRRPHWEWDFETMDVLFNKDVDNGNPVVNSVGEPYEVTAPYVIPVLMVERFEQWFDPSTILQYCNHRNGGTFWGADSGLAVCAGIKDRPDADNTFRGIRYRRVSYVFKFKLPMITNVAEGWKEILLNRGTFYWESGDKSKPRAFIAGGHRRLGNLKESGDKLGDNDALVYRKFNKLPQADFDNLRVNSFHIMS